MRNVSKQQVRKLVGKSIYAVRPDGSIVTGKLVRVHQNNLILAPLKKDKGKQVQTKAFLLPLVLFDLLAIGTIPFFGGGFGGGYGGGCGCGGYGGDCCNNNYNQGGYGGNYGNQGYGNQGYNGY